MKFLDLFAGIGGFRLGMEMANHQCVGFVERDKYARKSYEAIYNTEGEWTAHDITNVSDDTIRGIGSIDIITGGFPCQAFSIAGKRKGFADTRGTLFFEIMRFASILRPRYLFLENVTGLLNHENGITFETILRTMDELGYNAEWSVLNSKDYGVPQNRERVFIIGHLRGASTTKVFPIERTNSTINHTEVEKNNKVKEYQTFIDLNTNPVQTRISRCLTARYTAGITNHRGVNSGVLIKEATKQGYDIVTEGDSINLAVPGSKTRRGRVGKGIANTLDTSCNQGVLDGVKIRKLTPRECWRLQGFPDWAFDKAKEVNSDSQLYKQAGNSVTVNVIYEIARRLV